ncbi:uncharacterized protein LOC125760820 [Anopheles funestus]|uniref:uncharacterized protein LOC125760820 n=1 Tax=Anopheles funestus TaxID=62324 RepID=UPI0020C5D5AC|nr:uncharacterized protein LOC125760820 [Anopheles funestus]
MYSAAGRKSKQGDFSIKIEATWEPDVCVPPVVDEDDGDGDLEHNVGEKSSQSKDILAELCKQRAIPSSLELQLQEYFRQHPHIQPLPPSQSNAVDIDLADTDEETWIIQCPSTIDVKAELLNKKINLAAPHSMIKHCSVPLEAHVQINTEERVIGLQSGSRVKSFVPAGFVRINQALTALEVPVPSNTSNANHITVPYPEEIRVRHPLLGYDFNEHMRLPKRVRKQLSFAQQKAALMYQNAGKTKTSKKKSNTAAESTSDDQQTVSTKTRKRKQPSDEDDVIPRTVKQEPLSPKQKKSKSTDEVQTVNIKKEVTMEDDISWLLNI